MNDGVHDFTLRDLWVFVKNLSRGSALFRAMHGEEEAQWGLAEQLLAMNADVLNLLLWLKTADGAKGKNQPKPLPRPGVEDTDDGKKSIGDADMDFDELDAWLAQEFKAVN